MELVFYCSQRPGEPYTDSPLTLETAFENYLRLTADATFEINPGSMPTQETADLVNNVGEYITRMLDHIRNEVRNAK